MDELKKPLVTFALFAFNQEQYVSDAIEAAFAQTYYPLEIILSDDCSSDRTFELMQKAMTEYKGLHRIVLNRNQKNLNIGGHINKLADLASGDLIILAAGDDISIPIRTEKLVERWFEIGCRPAVLCSDFEPIDSESKLVDLPFEKTYRGTYSKQEMAAGNIRVLGATTAVSRHIFSAFPLLDLSVRHEDRVFPFRALILGGAVSLIDEKLIRYRVDCGISRDKAKSSRDYLFRQLPALLTRTLPDARQRLEDLDVIENNDSKIRRSCLKTIVNHEAGLNIIQRSGLDVERALFSGLLSGAHFFWLMRLYCKRRLHRIFSVYFDYRYGAKSK